MLYYEGCYYVTLGSYEVLLNIKISLKRPDAAWEKIIPYFTFEFPFSVHVVIVFYLRMNNS
jgi:hypothetical protein